MNYRLLFIMNAVAVAIFGVLFLVMPDFALTTFKMEKYASTVFVLRFLGGALLMAGILIWLAKELTDPNVERTLAITLLAGSIVGAVLTVVGFASANVIRANGWVLLVLHLIFVLGYGFLLSGVSIVPKGQQQNSGMSSQ